MFPKRKRPFRRETMTRDRDMRPRTGPRRRAGRWRGGLPALVAALALALATAGAASAATQPNVPGYNPAAGNRAIKVVTKTSAAGTKALHPRHKHPRQHH